MDGFSMSILAKYPRRRNVDFNAINEAALALFPSLVRSWLPEGKICGSEWTALNPHRPDRSLGSFKVNLRNGKWCDFATGDRGGDPVSLAAYVFQTSQVEAAT